MTIEGSTRSHLFRFFREKPLLQLALFFTLSRLVIYRFVPFRFSRIDDFMQFLDPALLRNDLLTSIGHLHTQPPLHNLMIGLILKFVPSSLQSHVTAGIYFLLALGIILGLYRLLIDRDVRQSIAFGTALAFSLSPTLIWAERLPVYVLPIMAALVGAMFCLQKYLAAGRLVYGLLFIAAIVYLPLTRSFFHLIVWLLPLLAGFLWLVRKTDRRRLPLYGAVTILGIGLVGGLYLKNLLTHGTFTGSTWQGMNIEAVTTLVPGEGIKEMVDRGEITPLALVPRFSPPGVYYRYYNRTPIHEHPALDDTLRSTGHVNYNNRIYAPAAREYRRNTLKIITTYPLETMLGTLNQFYLFCGLKSYRFFNAPERWWIPRTDSPLHTVQDIFLFYLIPFLIFLIICTAFFRFVRTFRYTIRRGFLSSGIPNPRIAGDLFAGFTLLYVALISMGAELGEGNLMRIQIDPFLAMTVGIVAETIVRKITSREDRRLPEHP